MSLKNSIVKHYRNNQAWIHKGKIETLAKNGEFGKIYLGETADRRLRELQNEGKLEKHPEKEGYYRATQPKRIVEYRVDGKLVETRRLWE